MINIKKSIDACADAAPPASTNLHFAIALRESPDAGHAPGS
jgi:hypothetical protein